MCENFEKKLLYQQLLLRINNVLVTSLWFENVKDYKYLFKVKIKRTQKYELKIFYSITEYSPTSFILTTKLQNLIQ